MANPLGIAIGQLLPSIFVSGDSPEGIPTLLLVEAIMATGKSRTAISFLPFFVGSVLTFAMVDC